MLRLLVYFLAVVIGSFLGGFVGSLAAIAIVYFLYRSKDRYANSFGAVDSDGTSGLALWVLELFQLMGYVAKIDGRVSESEIAVALVTMDEMGLDPVQRDVAKTNFSLGKSSGFDLHTAVNSLRSHVGAGSQLAVVVVYTLMRLSGADGKLSSEETQVIADVARSLEIHPRRIESLLRGFGHTHADFNDQHGNTNGRQQGVDAVASNQLRAAYEVLGVPESASNSEVKRSYRKLMSEYHPDKMEAKGVPEGMMKFAKEQSAAITNAWDIVKSYRGL